MTKWTRLARLEWEHVPIQAPWLTVIDTVAHADHVRIQAQGRWAIQPGDVMCGPEGVTALPFPDEELVIPDCRPGCLIGRLGSGGIDDSNTLFFPVGGDCLLSLPEGLSGPLAIGFNVLARPVRVESLKVVVTGATFAAS